jgi:C4-dicarboxylate-specific signal transduction histidine kinase
VAVFNLLLLNGVGGLTTLLAGAYHESQKRLAGLHADLERAYDETSRLNTEIQRSARFHVLGEVVAGVTHEIGNALQGAILSVDLVRQKVAAARPDVVRNLEQIEYGCATAMRIVKNVLLTARQSSEDHLPVSLADIARRTVELKGYDLRRDGIVLQLDFARDFPLVVGSPFRLQQVLLNLVTNAQDALRQSRGPKAIAIVGSTDINQAVLEVRDTGAGIPPDVMPRLFEPFYTTKVQGTGLGLAISADIVRRLGGDLTARNRPEGGAVFRLTLPVARTAGPPAPQLAAAPAREDAGPPAG